MKVLFAVSNDNISKLIVKKYQKDYKEIISYKNVYYFNAILKELQKDKSYDRIVISEDLETFANSNYQQMDKFIFDKLDNISDEAYNAQGENIPIILICSERRQKGEEILVKIFGIGVYDALIGKDRSIDEVCNLIKRPRSKKEAKEYYRIDTENVSYQHENENDVSEIEIQNILAHYKRIEKNEDKYVESFNNIALQYNDSQLKLICKVLPLKVKAVLEEKSPKYQQIMAFNKAVSEDIRNSQKNKKESEQSGTVEKLLVSPTSKGVIGKNVVIPSSINTDQRKRLVRIEKIQPKAEQQATKEETIQNDIEEFINNIESQEKLMEQPKQEEAQAKQEEVQAAKRGRGRPRKVKTELEDNVPQQPKRGRGRPRKNQGPEIEEQVNILPGFGESETQEVMEEKTDDTILPGFEDINEVVSQVESNDNILPGFENEDENSEEDTNSTILPGFEDEEQEDVVEDDTEDDEDITDEENWLGDTMADNKTTASLESTHSYANIDIPSLLTRDKKIVSFVGTSKNGTSFVLNNVAELLSSQGINVAILDATQNRNAYYIYTKNEDSLRRAAFTSIEDLKKGMAKGIKVNNNLTVYTSLPNKLGEMNDVEPILETLIKNHSLILIDCDFNTPERYFQNAQEIYLVQSMDVLTIQPLTEFLRDMKSREILTESKIRIIINKYIKLKSVSEKAIIGGMAFYNDPAMSYMTELFDRNTVKYLTIPFEEQIYSKYLDALINCNISLKGYSKTFMQILKQLGNSVYPLIAGKIKIKNQNQDKNQDQEQNQEQNQNQNDDNFTDTRENIKSFSESMKDTLNQMKNNY